ncbi:MAG: hypothetical protein L0L47_06975, partial [Bifidobacterium mongoliense]|nr:hypothetical protein [Bifidobacterium mongoliense]
QPIHTQSSHNYTLDPEEPVKFAPIHRNKVLRNWSIRGASYRIWTSNSLKTQKRYKEKIEELEARIHSMAQTDKSDKEEGLGTDTRPPDLSMRNGIRKVAIAAVAQFFLRSRR